jgi:tetratricopeptide (TPR) repeat protein
MDENQVLHLRLRLADRDDAPEFLGKIENPLSNVVNPHAKRIKIDEDEEALRTGQVPKEKIPDKIIQIASNYQEIGQTEKAIEFLKQALRIKNRPDGHILNLLGIYHGARGDVETQEKFYLEAAKAGAGSTSLFNLALARFQRKKYKEARKTIQDCIKSRGADGPALTLAAQIEEALGDKSAKDAFLQQALGIFGDPKTLGDWELGLLMTAARLSGKSDLLQKAQSEKNRRAAGKSLSSSSEGVLPEVAGALQKI